MSDTQRCPNCGATLYGLVKQCHSCGTVVNLAAAKAAEREAIYAERERRWRQTPWGKLSRVLTAISFWLRFGSLERAAKSGTLLLFEATDRGHGNTPVGNIMFRKDVFKTTLEAQGLDAWARIRAQPKQVSLTLTCVHCGAVHVIGGAAIGGFGDRYQGGWSTSFFNLIRPELQPIFGKHMMLCQRCGAKAMPKLRLF